MRGLSLVALALFLTACTDAVQTQEMINQGTQAIQQAGEKIPDVGAGFQAKVGEMDLAALEAKYESIEAEIKNLTQALTEKKDQGLEKVEDVQAKLKAAQEAFEETKAALDKLNEAGQELKDSVTPGGN